MRRCLQNNRNNKHIRKKYNRRLRQKERHYYNNLRKSGNSYSLRKSNKTYFKLYEKHRNGKRSISQNKYCVSNKITEIPNFDGRRTIALPDYIDFYKKENRNSTIKALLSIYSCQQEKILIDFKDVVLMSASATAMLFSTIKHIKSNCNKQVKIDLPQYKKTLAILEQIKLLDFMGVSNLANANQYEDVRCWYARDGHEFLSSKDISKMVNGIIENSKSNNIDIEKYKKKIDITISETLLNVTEHAYLKCDFSYKNWVFFAQFIKGKDNKGGKLFLVMCDSGVGIVKTFKGYIDDRNPKWQRLAKFLKTENDYIKEAVTNTYQVPRKKNVNKDIRPGRGTGLTKIYNDSKKMKNSSLNIYSHESHFSSAGNSVKFKRYFPGTVIELLIPLDE